MKPDHHRSWLEQRRNVDKLVYGIWAICALLVVAEFFYHKHPHFAVDGFFAFYAGFGFLSYCTIVLSAKAFRRWVKRDEDYYGD